MYFEVGNRSHLICDLFVTYMWPMCPDQIQMIYILADVSSRNNMNSPYLWTTSETEVVSSSARHEADVNHIDGEDFWFRKIQIQCILWFANTSPEGANAALNPLYNSWPNTETLDHIWIIWCLLIVSHQQVMPTDDSWHTNNNVSQS